MSDKPPPKELIELPLSHKKTWHTVDKGGDGEDQIGERLPRHPRERVAAAPRRRRWVLWIVVAVLAGLAYWLFWPSAPRIEFSSMPLEFAPQLAGESSAAEVVVLKNVGERPLRVDAVGVAAAPSVDFVTDSDDCSGMELPTQAECRVGVRFAPQSTGARSGQLEIVGNMRGKRTLLSLTGEAVAPRLASRPEVLDFGPESVGATSPGRDLALVNAGTAPLTIESVSVDSPEREFRMIGNQCSSTRLEPEESCGLRLVFKPGLLGERAARLAVASDTFGETMPIALQGSGSGPDLRVDPPGLTFEDQLVGTRSDVARLTLTNHGDAVFRINRAWLADAGSFAVVGETCSGASVDPGESCSVEIAFEPATAGEVRTSLQIRESSGGMAPGVGVAGRGVSPRLGLSTDSLDFGAVLVGEQASEEPIGLANDGTATLEISELRVVGDDGAAFPKGRDGCSGVELAPGQRCEVVVGFRPRHGGGHRARVVVNSNQRGTAPAIELAGHARAPRLSLDRQRLDFAAVRQSESQDLRVQVANAGDAPLSIGAVRSGGAAAPDFDVAADGCSRRSLDAEESCQLVVRFTPSANGPRDGRLIIESDAGEGAVSLVLRGVGLAPPEPAIDFAPRTIDFGGRPLGDRSEVLTVTIASVGEGPLRISDVRLAGPDAADFRIVPGTCQGLPYVVPGGDCTVGIRFTPTMVGPRAARLIIEHNADRGEIEVSLAAEGF